MALALGTNVGFVTTAPTADPAGANTTIDGSSVVVKHTTPSDALRITQIGWYRGSGTNTANFEIALYSESAGVAATRLFVDATNSSSAGGWITVAVDWAVSPSTAYWLGLQMDAHTGSSTVDSATSGGSGTDVLTSQTTLNNPYGGGAVADADGMYAIYALLELMVPVDQTSTSIGRIQKTIDQTLSSIGRIQKSADTTSTSIARIQITTDQNTTSVANIEVPDAVDQFTTSIGRIQKTIDNTLSSIGRIQNVQDRTSTSLGRIQNIQDRTLTGVSRIQITSSATSTSRGRMQNFSDASVTGVARMQAITDRTLSCVGRIGIIGGPEFKRRTTGSMGFGIRI